MPSRRLTGVALALACGGAVGHAAVARADDRSAAEEILKTLAPTSTASTDDAVKQTRDALERGTRMRVAGDLAHAKLAEGLALEWAGVARDRARTEAAEKEARTSELAAIEAGARVERERALLEDAIARAGRFRAELGALTKGAAKTKERTTTFASGEPKGPAPKAQPEGADAPSSEAASSRDKKPAKPATKGAP